MKTLRYWIAALAAIGFYLALTAVQIKVDLRQNGGWFVYPLDDAYIHLSVARNLVAHGVWGISPDSFSGASSSPAWTLLLAAAIRLFGTHLAFPLALNLVFGTLLLALACRTFQRWAPEVPPLRVFAVLIAIVLITPLPGLSLIGMEGTLQSLSIAALAVFSAEILSSDATSPRIFMAWLIAAFVAAASRYETLFFVAAFALVALALRRFVLLLQLAVVTAVPPLLYAIYAVRHGGYALPFSVIVKSHQAHATGPLTVSIANLAISPIAPVLMVALITAILRWRAQPGLDRTQTLLFLFVGVATLHLLFGPIGWLMRYEAYLYALGTLAVGLAILEHLATLHKRVESGGSGEPWYRPFAPVSLALLIALVPTLHDLIARAHHGYLLPVESAHDRYVEHLPAALFVRDFYRGRPVVANDIGFIAYYGDASILDPIGLGSIQPVRLIRSGKELTATDMQTWSASQNADLAILQTDYPNISEIVPSGWILVQTWCYPRNIVFRDHTISFFAPTKQKADELRANLDRFTPPSKQLVRADYVDGATRAAQRPLSEEAPCVEGNAGAQTAGVR